MAGVDHTALASDKIRPIVAKWRASQSLGGGYRTSPGGSAVDDSPMKRHKVNDLDI
jgi:hypothetical protein